MSGWLKPAGWPDPNRDVVALMVAAREEAVERGHCWLGLEHLLMALPRIRGGGRMTDAVRLRLSSINPGVLEQLSIGLTEAPGEPDPTPWTRGLGVALQPGFDLDHIWRTIAESLHAGLESLLGDLLPTVDDDGVQTRPPTGVRAMPVARRHTPDARLALVWGPRGGAALAPRRGAILGRASAETDIDLYDGTPVTDRSLSRTHLRWLSWGEVEMLREGLALHQGGQRLVLRSGRVEVGPGDILQLTQATWIEVLR
jgi:hypothetical protein